jgi:protein required for attachment to host cells
VIAATRCIALRCIRPLAVTQTTDAANVIALGTDIDPGFAGKFACGVANRRSTIDGLEVSMVPTLFVVADQSQAHLYRVGGTKLNPTLEAIEQLDHPEARERLDPSESNAHLRVDMSGSDAEEERRFVRELVDRLRKGQSTGEFRKLYIAAPANFVGRLRKHYGSSLSRTVEREIIGDYTQQDERALVKRFAQWID